MTTTTNQTYAHPEVLVDTEWLLKHHRDADVRVVEVDYDPAANYALGHVPGAVLFDWKRDINDPVRRELLSKEQLEALFANSGIGPETLVVLYGDFNNWFAAFAYWALTYYGVRNLRLLNGGRKKWLLEDKPLTKDIPSYPKTTYKASGPRKELRAYREEVLRSLGNGTTVLVDVRGPKEYSGEILAPPEYPTEHAQRGGHIPGAKSIPWAQAVNDADGTFKTAAELAALYAPKGVTPEKEVITYCRIGERSSHSWFVLTYLLGYPNVRNYDGSWTEWGNSIGAPIEK